MKHKNNIINLNGHAYEIILGPKECNPCDLCDVRKLCKDPSLDPYNDYLMLCGCAFITMPYYVKQIN